MSGVDGGGGPWDELLLGRGIGELNLFTSTGTTKNGSSTKGAGSRGGVVV